MPKKPMSQEQQRITNNERFYRAWAAHTKNGFAATQDEANRLAKQFAVSPAPQIAPTRQEATGEEPMGDHKLAVEFGDEERTGLSNEHLAAKAVIRLHYDLLIHLHIMANQMQHPGKLLPANRASRILAMTKVWAEAAFPTLKPSVRYANRPKS